MVEALLDFSYLGNEAWRWTTALGIAAGTFIVLLLLRRLIKSRYARLAATPQDEIMEVPLHVAARTTVWFLLIAAIHAGAQALVLPPKVARLVLTAFTIATFWQVGLWATTAVVASLERKERRTLAVDRAAAGTFGIIGFLARATIWSFVLLLTLDNLGIQIKPLLAGLGIGGIAVALAAQNILGDDDGLRAAHGHPAGRQREADRAVPQGRNRVRLSDAAPVCRAGHAGAVAAHHARERE